MFSFLFLFQVQMQVDGIHDDSLAMASDSEESASSMPDQQLYSKDDLVSLLGKD